MAKNKWTWKAGRLHHPTEHGISLNINEAYRAQEKNDDIADACEDVLKPYDKRLEGINGVIITELRIRENGRKRMKGIVS